MEELMPCPFCYGKMKVDYRLKPLKYAVVHVSNFYFSDMCYGGTDYEFDSEEEAIKAWNRRAKDEPEVLHNMLSRGCK